MSNTRLYVGVNKRNERLVFRSERIPTETTHGNTFAYVIGPFRTRKGADFMAEYGANNPHCQTVSDAEWIAKQQSN